jgi:predicted transcriptional regulator
MSKKRDKLEIIKDILETVRDKGDKVKPTHIMYKANLSHQMLTDYTNDLLHKQLMELKVDKKGKRTFSLTEKGFNYLKDYKMIRGFVDSYGIE